MRHLKMFFLVAGVFLALATASFPASTAPATTGEIKGTTGAAAKPAGKTTTAPVSTEKPVAKKSPAKDSHQRRRVTRHASGEKARIAEPAPGERLTIRQVIELLKTTRNFAGKNLSSLRLVAFDLTKCNMKGADLSNANLERADVEETNLELADLSGANLKMTDLRISGIKGAKLDRATFDGAIWLDGTVCAKGSIGLCREFPDRFKVGQ